MPERMEETLRQRLIEAKLAGARWDERHPFAYAFRSNEQAADAALAALGLDDLDAAVERVARVWCDEEGFPFEETYLGSARRLLEAALTATPESEGPDA